MSNSDYEAGEKRSVPDIGCGLVALISTIGAVIFNFMSPAVILGLFIVFSLGSINSLLARKPYSALGWILAGLGALIGYYIMERWGVLVGVIIGTLIMTPLINKMEGS